MISLSQRLLPDDTQHSQQTDRQTCFPVRFEPTISADERLQTDALDRAATGIGIHGDTTVNKLRRQKASYSVRSIHNVGRDRVCVSVIVTWLHIFCLLVMSVSYWLQECINLLAPELFFKF